ncbi:MAG TPA: type II toxin-antitoxin system RelE/ParE family toxin [Geobacteraceae bacterium]
MKIRILSAAAQDLLDGYRFYEMQEAGLGNYFLDSLCADVDSLLIYAGAHPVCFGPYHRLQAKRFPFAIYYKLDGDLVLVHAVLDCRRNPAWTRAEIRNEKGQALKREF